MVDARLRHFVLGRLPVLPFFRPEEIGQHFPCIAMGFAVESSPPCFPHSRVGRAWRVLVRNGQHFPSMGWGFAVGSYPPCFPHSRYGRAILQRGEFLSPVFLFLFLYLGGVLRTGPPLHQLHPTARNVPLRW